MAENGSMRDLETDVRVSVLETEISHVNKSIEKIEVKIDENYKVLHNDIDTKHQIVMSTLADQTKASTEQHAALANKIGVLERWRWMLIGAGLVFGYILAHLKLEKLF